ncbi:hypothetical protein ACUXV3_02315 [Roseobacteraceae bacterium NS-SX3]
MQRDGLARACGLLLAAPELTGHVNAAAETGEPVHEIGAEIARRTGHNGSYLVRSQKHVQARYGSWAEGPCLDQQMSSRKLRALCGWRPVYGRFLTAKF